MIDSSDLIKAYHEAKDSIEQRYTPIAMQSVGHTVINGIRYNAELTLVQDLSVKREGAAIREIELSLVKSEKGKVKRETEDGRSEKGNVRSEKGKVKRGAFSTNDISLGIRALPANMEFLAEQLKARAKK